MRLSYSMFLILFAAVFAAAALRITILSIGAQQNVPGCPSLSTTGVFDPTQTVAFWLNQPIPPTHQLAQSITDWDRKVLGASTEEKWIEVDLGKQKLIAHQGDQIFLETLVSTGLYGKTPPGEYTIWYKIVATKMEGGNKSLGTYYNLPNVPYTMFFNKDIGIHGTYWHQNFGQPMSHGCVNTPTPIAEKLFYWAGPQLPDGQYAVRSSADNPGTRVVVHL